MGRTNAHIYMIFSFFDFTVLDMLSIFFVMLPF